MHLRLLLRVHIEILSFFYRESKLVYTKYHFCYTVCSITFRNLMVSCTESWRASRNLTYNQENRYFIIRFGGKELLSDWWSRSVTDASFRWLPVLDPWPNRVKCVSAVCLKSKITAPIKIKCVVVACVKKKRTIVLALPVALGLPASMRIVSSKQYRYCVPVPVASRSRDSVLEPQYCASVVLFINFSPCTLYR
jgi:hypothetical protein